MDRRDARTRAPRHARSQRATGASALPAAARSRSARSSLGLLGVQLGLYLRAPVGAGALLRGRATACDRRRQAPLLLDRLVETVDGGAMRRDRLLTCALSSSAARAAAASTSPRAACSAWTARLACSDQLVAPVALGQHPLLADLRGLPQFTTPARVDPPGGSDYNSREVIGDSGHDPQPPTRREAAREPIAAARLSPETYSRSRTEPGTGGSAASATRSATSRRIRTRPPSRPALSSSSPAAVRSSSSAAPSRPSSAAATASS